MDHFYVTLPSNSSEQYFGKQPLCNYKTRLVKPVQLAVEEWEVGLAEIIYPHSWNNIRNGSFKIKMMHDTEWKWKKVSVPIALYESPNQLVTEINIQVKAVLGTKNHDKLYFSYSSLKRKLIVYLSHGYEVHFPSELAVALGFGDEDATLSNSRETNNVVLINGQETPLKDQKKKIEGPFHVDLNRGLHTFFIYCNLVDYQFVGDANVPLLRAIPVSGSNGDVLVEKFQNIHYMDLSRSTFQEIEIHITDDTGANVPFEQGRVIVKLHFRKK